MRNLILIPALALTACVTLGGGTGAVQQIGKDSYTVRVLSPKSTSDSKQRALTAANTHCQKDKRNLMLVNEYAGTEDGTAEKFYDLTFMCLTPGDQDFQRIRKETLIPAASQPAQ